MKCEKLFFRNFSSHFFRSMESLKDHELPFLREKWIGSQRRCRCAKNLKNSITVFFSMYFQKKAFSNFFGDFSRSTNFYKEHKISQKDVHHAEVLLNRRMCISQKQILFKSISITCKHLQKVACKKLSFS